MAITADLKVNIDQFMAAGGKLLLSGTAGLDESGAFAVDFGVRFEGKNEFCPTYLRPAFDLEPNGMTSYVMYSSNYRIGLSADFNGEVTASCVDPYFNRDYRHFCSHRHTPYDREALSNAVVVTENVAYIGWNIFGEYAEQGSLHLRKLVEDTVERLIGATKTLSTNLPSCGVTTLMRQGDRLVNHLLYGVAKVRGKGVEVIEDLPTVANTVCTVKVDVAPRRIYLAPAMEELPFTYEAGTVTYTVPAFSCGTMVVIES